MKLDVLEKADKNTREKGSISTVQSHHILEHAFLSLLRSYFLFSVHHFLFKQIKPV